MDGPKILFVDDEMNILQGIKRKFHNRFNIVIAQFAENGLKELETNGPFAAVFSDMNMPKMDGLEFLKIVKKKYPDTVRTMLTGLADVNIAMSAVNEGAIFRFLTKPCPDETLVNTITAAIEHNNLLTAEKTLLQKTFSGALKVLVDTLGLANPVAATHATQIRNYIRLLLKALPRPDAWKIEIAGMLCQIGCVTIPRDTFDKIYSTAELTLEEKDIWQSYPVIGHDLISNIPRLEDVAQILRVQLDDFPDHEKQTDVSKLSPINFGRCALKLATDFDMFITKGSTIQEALNYLTVNAKGYHPEILFQFKHMEFPEIQEKKRAINVLDLQFDMLLAEDLTTNDGVLLAKKNQEISKTMCQMIKNYYFQGKLNEEIYVVNN
ncbi:MAG: response regulator [Fibrobacterales bacterium]